MYTKKQLSDKLGVSKSTVYRLIREQNIKYERKQGQTMLYADSVLNRLEKVLNQSYGGSTDSDKPVHESITKDQLIDQLRSENQRQAESIRWLQNQLEAKERTLQIALADNHQLNHRLGIDAPLDEQDNDKNVSVEQEKTTNAKKKHWWQLW